MRNSYFALLPWFLLLATSSPCFADASSEVRERLMKAFSAKMHAEFLAQQRQDSITPVTNNSFLDKKYVPIEGAAVLLVVGINRWEDTRRLALDV